MPPKKPAASRPQSQRSTSSTSRATRTSGRTSGSLQVDVSDYSALARTTVRGSSRTSDRSGTQNQTPSRPGSAPAEPSSRNSASTAALTAIGNDLATIAEADTPIPTIERDIHPVVEDAEEEGEEVGINPEQTPGGGSPTPHPRPPQAGTRSPPTNRPRSPFRQLTPQPVPDVERPTRSPSHSPRPLPPARSPTPRWATPEADPRPDPDPGAGDEALSPEQPRKPFRLIFWKQVIDGMRYFARWRTGVVLSLTAILFYLQVCSLGNICDQMGVVWVLGRAFRGHPVDYICLLVANTLTIAGTMDVFAGFASVIREIGKREARREKPDLVDRGKKAIWKEVVAFPGAYATAFTTAFATALIESPKDLLQDFYEEVMEPVLMLTLTFALRWVFDIEGVDSSVQLVTVSMVLHLIKWSCDAIAICYGVPDSWLQPQKRLFVFVLLLLTMIVVHQKRHSISLDPWEGFKEAQWFNNARTSEQKPIGRVHVQHLAAERPHRVGPIVHKVTNRVVTKWVEPTRRA